MAAVIAACQRLREARDAQAEALAEKDRALVVWWEQSGIPKVRAGEAVQAALAEAGWSPEDIARVGVGAANVRITLERRGRG
jgi:3-oxoacyl-[acyl-carrier-protein] synthase III